jgi:VanZ like family
MDPQGNAGHEDRAIRILGRAASLRSLSVTCIVIVTLVLTLSPSGDRALQPFSFTFAFDLHGVADDLLNIGLFVPLGLALGWNSRRLAPAIVCGLLLSTAIELIQTIVPGRDPSLSDIIFNTLGAGLGALLGRRPQAWLAPSTTNSILLTVASVIAAVSVMIATVFARPTVGQGWEVLLDSGTMTAHWSLVLNGLWMLILCIPIGFWARGRMLVIASAVMAILLVLIPELTSAKTTSLMEWLGVAAGLLAGVSLRSLARSVARS